MICYHCKNIMNCHEFRALHCLSSDFDIKQCKSYDAASNDKYKKIAEHDDLMLLIFDYFTNQLEDGVSEEEAKAAITRAMLEL